MCEGDRVRDLPHTIVDNNNHEKENCSMAPRVPSAASIRSQMNSARRKAESQIRSAQRQAERDVNQAVQKAVRDIKRGI